MVVAALARTITPRTLGVVSEANWTWRRLYAWADSFPPSPLPGAPAAAHLETGRGSPSATTMFRANDELGPVQIQEARQAVTNLEDDRWAPTLSEAQANVDWLNDLIVARRGSAVDEWASRRAFERSQAVTTPEGLVVPKGALETVKILSTPTGASAVQTEPSTGTAIGTITDPIIGPSMSGETASALGLGVNLETKSTTETGPLPDPGNSAGASPGPPDGKHPLYHDHPCSHLPTHDHYRGGPQILSGTSCRSGDYAVHPYCSGGYPEADLSSQPCERML